MGHPASPLGLSGTPAVVIHCEFPQILIGETRDFLWLWDGSWEHFIASVTFFHCSPSVSGGLLKYIYESLIGDPVGSSQLQLPLQLLDHKLFRFGPDTPELLLCKAERWSKHQWVKLTWRERRQKPKRIMEKKKARVESSHSHLYVLVDTLTKRCLLTCGSVINNFKMSTECHGDINNWERNHSRYSSLRKMLQMCHLFLKCLSSVIFMVHLIHECLV